VAKAAGLSQSHVSRVENAARTMPRLDELARHAAVLGHELSLKAFPVASPVRDAGQLRLLARFRARVDARWGWRSEVPVGGFGDRRAWDVELSGPGRVAVDAETHLHDLQALQRRCETKLRDGSADRLVLLVAATVHNRRVLREHRQALSSTLPLDTGPVMAALDTFELPHANGIVIL
jgi:transcriptional regulator with XRE-family HTH domain